MSITVLFIIWIIGSIVNLFTNVRIRDYKDYPDTYIYLLITLTLSITLSWALIYLNIVNGEFYIPKWIYHNCMKHSIITIEDTDYDKDGNIMAEYNETIFGHRETYKVYTCKYCGKEIKRERLQ